MLVVASATEVDRYFNVLSVLYLSIVGAWIVPGTHKDALTLMEGVLLDNRNEYLYASVQAEGKGGVCAPSLYAEDSDAMKKSRLAAMKAFGQEFTRRACRLSPSPRGDRYETPGK